MVHGGRRRRGNSCRSSLSLFVSSSSVHALVTLVCDREKESARKKRKKAGEI